MNTFKTIITFAVIGLIIYILYPAHKIVTEQAGNPGVTAISTSTTQTNTISTLPTIVAKPLTTKYIKAQEWPPKLTVLDQIFSCDKVATSSPQGAQIVKKKIGNRDYCVSVESEGAAGSTYITYNYSLESIKDIKKTYVLEFVLREVQCLNYDNPQQSECLVERKNFNVDSIVEGIVKGSNF